MNEGGTGILRERQVSRKEKREIGRCSKGRTSERVRFVRGRTDVVRDSLV